AGLELNRLGECGQRGVEFLLPKILITKVVVGLRVIRVELNGPLVGGDGLIRFAAATEGMAEIAMGTGQIGSHFEGYETFRASSLPLAVVVQGEAEADVGVCIVHALVDLLLCKKNRSVPILSVEETDAEIANDKLRWTQRVGDPKETQGLGIVGRL